MKDIYKKCEAFSIFHQRPKRSFVIHIFCFLRHWQNKPNKMYVDFSKRQAIVLCFIIFILFFFLCFILLFDCWLANTKRSVISDGIFASHISHILSIQMKRTKNRNREQDEGVEKRIIPLLNLAVRLNMMIYG